MHKAEERFRDCDKGKRQAEGTVHTLNNRFKQVEAEQKAVSKFEMILLMCL